MKLSRVTRYLPSSKNAGLALLSAILSILAFPDFEFWFLAWFSLVPLLFSIEREKDSTARSFFLGWLWGFVFFTGTCWWLTFAPINYAAFPWAIAYFLLFCLTGFVALFFGVLAAVLSFLIRRKGPVFGLTEAAYLWVVFEFARYWLTGNNWNSIGYSQAFGNPALLTLVSWGGIYLMTFGIVGINVLITIFMVLAVYAEPGHRAKYVVAGALFCGMSVALYSFQLLSVGRESADGPGASIIVAIQPNVPMSGLTYEKWKQLRQKHVELAEPALTTIDEQRTTNTTVIFPESPMNFAYEEDEEFRQFVHAFAAKHDVNVLFNSAEPDTEHDKYFNSAVLVGPNGKEIAQYDKIYLLPFGESVPAPLQSIVPAFVGSFSYGKEYDLLPLGDAKAGVMICFESHFGELSREYVRNGADAIIEMTNDGYLGPTPVLRQHLANAIFRAVETNRPVLRVTNVGITTYVSERGEVLDASEPYTEATRLWSVAKSNGSRTLYVKYGDWFAWLCVLLTAFTLVGSSMKRRA